MYPANEKRFLLVNYLTIVALFVLILAGGIVRSTGSGMGCPDWPKCFGQYIPPTHISQLPSGYQQHFIEQRVKKNIRFANTLDFFGFGQLANEIRDDKSISAPEEFNASKTWTEYVNRLVGALTGLLLFLSAILSVVYLKSKRRVFFLSFLNLILVGFQAWLGSIVVSTNLAAWIVTVHMVVALGILAISIYTYFHAKILRDRQVLANKAPGLIKSITVIALILTVIQVILGTEVREKIDGISALSESLKRADWVGHVGFLFDVHRNLAVLVLLINGALLVLMRRKYLGNSYQFKFVSYNMLFVFSQIVVGVTLSYLALPPVSQALHIVLASLLFGSQFYLLLLLKQNKLYKTR